MELDSALIGVSKPLEGPGGPELHDPRLLLRLAAGHLPAAHGLHRLRRRREGVPRGAALGALRGAFGLGTQRRGLLFLDLRLRAVRPMVFGASAHAAALGLWL